MNLDAKARQLWRSVKKFWEPTTWNKQKLNRRPRVVAVVVVVVAGVVVVAVVAVVAVVVPQICSVFESKPLMLVENASAREG